MRSAKTFVVEPLEFGLEMFAHRDSLPVTCSKKNISLLGLSANLIIEIVSLLASRPL